MHGLVRADLGRRAFDDHAAVVHHRHLLGDGERDVHVVLDEDQRDVPVEAEQELGQQLTLAARQAGRRLVEHERLRLSGERHRDRDLAVLAVREVADQLAELVRIATRPAASRARSRIARSRPGRRTGRSRPPSHPDDGQVDRVLDGQAVEEA